MFFVFGRGEIREKNSRVPNRFYTDPGSPANENSDTSDRSLMTCLETTANKHHFTIVKWASSLIKATVPAGRLRLSVVPVQNRHAPKTI